MLVPKWATRFGTVRTHTVTHSPFNIIAVKFTHFVAPFYYAMFIPWLCAYHSVFHYNKTYSNQKGALLFVDSHGGDLLYKGGIRKLNVVMSSHWLKIPVKGPATKSTVETKTKQTRKTIIMFMICNLLLRLVPHTLWDKLCETVQMSIYYNIWC